MSADEEAEEPLRLSQHTQDQIERLALLAVANMTTVVTAAIQQIVHTAQTKIGDTIANAEIKQE